MALKEVKQAWGKEVWIANEPEYRAKLLYLDATWHYHKKTKETFSCLKGKVSILIADDSQSRIWVHHFLNPGDTVTVLPGQPHTLSCLEESTIIEIASQYDDDVYRLI